MKGALTLLLCFWLMACCTTTAWAQLPEEVEEALPEAAEELLEAYEPLVPPVRARYLPNGVYRE